MSVYKIGRYYYKTVSESESFKISDEDLFALLNEGDVIKYLRRVNKPKNKEKKQ